MATIAVHGGAPVRTRPFSYQCVGGNLIGDEELSLVTEVVKAQSLFRHYGPVAPHMADDFEREAAAFLGRKYVLALATGSGAFFCAAAALKWGSEDEVIIPTYGWITDYACVSLAGARPVFAEVDQSLNMSPEAFEARITDKTKAVIVVHYQGGTSRIGEICAIAKRRGIQVLEDSAQTWIRRDHHSRPEATSDVMCFSLQSHKMITSGDGGVLATDDQELYERAVRFHDLGLLREAFCQRLESPVITRPFCGMQWRMNELTAAVALAQLRKLPEMLKTVKKNWHYLRDSIAEAFPDLKFRAVPPEDDSGILLAFDLLTSDNAGFFAHALEAEGIVYGPTSYCKTMDRIDVVRACLEDTGRYSPHEFEATEQLVQRYAKIAILPVYSEEDMSDIARACVKVLGFMRNQAMI